MLLSHVQLFANLWTEAHLASLSFTVSWSLIKFMPIESGMPSSLSSSAALFFFCSQSFQHQGLFQRVSSLYQIVKVLELQLHPQSFPWMFRLISFSTDWFDLLAVHGTLRSLFQHHGLKASILLSSAFLMVQLSHLFMTTGKAVSSLTIQTFAGKVMSLLF